MSIFDKLWKEGWFNPDLDIDLELEDIDTKKLKEQGSIIVQKGERVYRISIPSDDQDNLKEEDIKIEELPGVAAKGGSSPEHFAR